MHPKVHHRTSIGLLTKSLQDKCHRLIIKVHTKYLGFTTLDKFEIILVKFNIEGLRAHFWSHSSLMFKLNFGHLTLVNLTALILFQDFFPSEVKKVCCTFRSNLLQN